MATKQSLDKVMNLATLPPTSGSAKQHSLRAFLLLQKCHGNELDCRHTQWGSEMRADVLLPVDSDNSPAHQRLLDLVSCSCTLGCITAT